MTVPQSKARLRVMAWMFVLASMLVLGSGSGWAQKLTSDGASGGGDPDPALLQQNDGTTPARPPAANSSSAAPTSASDAPATASAPSGNGDLQKPEDRCVTFRLIDCFKDIGHDQAAMWTSPAKIRPHDLEWILPVTALTVVALRTDADTSQDIGFYGKWLHPSLDVSQLGAGYTLFGAGAGLWTLGAATHNSHLAETGMLSLEALADSAIIGEALKFAANRQRPEPVPNEGRFWAHGAQGIASSSFPSGHAITTWAVARVITTEYPQWQVQLAAYGVATAVSISRITAQAHFPSDVIVGSTLGFLIGDYVGHHRGTGLAKVAGIATPVADPTTRSYGVALKIPSDQITRLLLKPFPQVAPGQ